MKLGVGVAEDTLVPVGDGLGALGTVVGTVVGRVVGTVVGAVVGLPLGPVVGTVVAIVVGTVVGAVVITAVALEVGLGEVDPGKVVDTPDGDADGETTGTGPELLDPPLHPVMNAIAPITTRA